jgi:hypothetical protein
VNYSYGGNQPVTTERREGGRLLLPEDSKIMWLMNETVRLEREVKEWKEKYLAENIDKTNHQKELARVENKTTEEHRSRLPLTDLQIEAIRLSSELLNFLKRLGPAPTPKYTATELHNMDAAQVKVLMNAQDGDFLDACEYHLGDKHYFGQTKRGLENESTARATRMLMWHRKLEAAYALEALIAPIPYKGSEQHIRSTAAKLWELAFEVGENGNA